MLGSPFRGVRCFAGLTMLVICAGGVAARAATCTVIGPHKPSEAENAFLHSDYDRAVTLYRAQLQEKPNDPALTAGLTEVLLKQQKVTEADDLVQKALTQSPQSPLLMAALAEVQYRAGTPWLALPSVDAAIKLDLCNPRARLISATILRTSSYYAAAAKEISTAHALDPYNPRTRSRWLDTLPLNERIAELEAYLANPNGEDAETLKGLRFYLAYLKQREIEPHKACRLVSQNNTAEIPFAPIMRDATHIRAFGLDVKLNDHDTRLQIDTGATGLLISRSVADHAGLKQFSRTEVGGIGSQGRKAAYTTFADDIKIGSLEFKDCAVEVIDKGNITDTDGLIGMDVFSRFLVTLDYPMRKLLLAPLPARPDEPNEPKPALETHGNSSEGESPDNTAPQPATATAPKPAAHGPYDRYIAPEMKDWTHVYRVGHNLLLPASLNNSPPKLFIVDTGAFSTSVTPEVAREVTKVHSQDYLSIRGVNGKVDKVYTADSITVRFANVSQRVDSVVAFETPQLSKNLNIEVAGFIGITALGQMTISIDYRDGLMKFAYDPKRGYRFPQ
jgi:predicted aspartyl protease/Flp pilus assembly protein TadD